MQLGGSSPTLRNVIFDSNRAPNGAAVLLSASSPAFFSCRFASNHATQRGGAVFVDERSSFRATDSVFSNNSAPIGGGLFAENGGITLTRVTLIRNAAT